MGRDGDRGNGGEEIAGAGDAGDVGGNGVTGGTAATANNDVSRCDARRERVGICRGDVPTPGGEMPATGQRRGNRVGDVGAR